MDIRAVNKQFDVDFIKLYKSLPCLWDRKGEDYRDNDKRKVAYNMLVTLYKQVDPNANKQTVTKRINCIRTTYRREIRRAHAKAKVSGKPYKSTLWYFPLLKFLHGTYVAPNGVVSDKTDECDDDEDYYDNDETDRIHVEYLEEYKPKETSDNSIKFEKDALSVSSEEMAPESPNPETGQVSLRGRESDGGRYYHFGRHVADQLDRLSDEMALYCQKVIIDALFQAQMETLTSKSKITTS